MRRVVYQGMLSLPVKTVSGATGLLGAVGAIWPEQVQSKARLAMTPDHIRALGIVLLIAALVYFVLLWLLKPGEASASSPGGGQATHGHSSPAIHTNYGPITIGSPPPAERQERKQTDPSNHARDRRGGGPFVMPLNQATADRMRAKANPRPDMALKEVARRVYDTMGPEPDHTKQREEFRRRLNLTIADAIQQHDLHVWARYADFPIKLLDNYSLEHVIVDVAGDCIHVPNEWRTNTYTDVQFMSSEIDLHLPPSSVVEGPRVERDTPLPEALGYIVTGTWGQRFFDVVAAGEGDAAEGPLSVRQVAHDGRIRIWGKKSEGGIHVLIPPDYWVDHGIEWFELLRGKSKTESKSYGAASAVYTDLMVSRAEIMQEWPHVKS